MSGELDGPAHSPSVTIAVTAKISGEWVSPLMVADTAQRLAASLTSQLQKVRPPGGLRGYRLVLLDEDREQWAIFPQMDAEDMPGVGSTVQLGTHDAVFWIQTMEDLRKQERAEQAAREKGNIE